MKVELKYAPYALFSGRYLEINIFGHTFRIGKPNPRPSEKRRIIRSRMAVTIGGKRFWKNQLVGKSYDQLATYFAKRSILLSPEDLTSIYNFINNKII